MTTQAARRPGFRPVRRILSLLPSATEIVFALGLGDRLVGVTAECDHPPQARTKPVVSRPRIEPGGGGLSPAEIDAAVTAALAAGEPMYRIDRALVRRLQPDLILAQDLCAVCAVPSGHVTAALATLGVEAAVLSLDPQRLDDVIACIEQVGRVANAEAAAAALRARWRARLAAWTARPLDPPPAVLALEWAEPPWIAGHWVPDMIAAAGGRDVLGFAGAPSRRASWTEIAASDPDIVVFMPCGFDLAAALEQGRTLLGQPVFAGLRAVVQGRAFAVDGSAYFSRPGPRLIEGVAVLGNLLRGAPTPGALPLTPG